MLWKHQCSHPHMYVHVVNNLHVHVHVHACSTFQHINIYMCTVVLPPTGKAVPLFMARGTEVPVHDFYGIQIIHAPTLQR